MTAGGLQGRIRRRSAFALLALALCGVGQPAWAGFSAVVYVYHRFGEDDVPSTNIRLEQFERHIAELKSGPYTVMGVPEIVAAIEAGRPLPDRTIGLTVDDGYRSVLTEGWPRLKRAGLPLTLFVSTDAIDRGGGRYLTWDEIRRLAREGVTIGAHSASHLHMTEASVAENEAELARSNARFKAELGFVPSLFAYPYGEYGLAAGATVRKAGYAAAFGQHSGVISRRSNFYFLPRIALNEAYGDISRFRLTASALPLPVKDVVPADMVLDGRHNPPLVGFTVLGQAAKRLETLHCYTSAATRIEMLGERRVEVRIAKAFPPGRARINCTMPGPEGRWRWFGLQFFVRGP